MIHKSHDAERRAVFAGSFNPFTIGHMSILRRGLGMFDHITVVIGVNDSKRGEPQDADARVAAVKAAVDGMENVDVMSWSGLTADAARLCGAGWLLRGVRSVADFEYERGMAEVNRMISGIDTVMLFAEPELSSVSSSVVRELQRHGHDVSQFLPADKSDKTE